MSSRRNSPNQSDTSSKDTPSKDTTSKETTPKDTRTNEQILHDVKRILSAPFYCINCGVETTYLASVGKRSCKNRHKYGDTYVNGVRVWECCPTVRADTKGRGCVHSDHVKSNSLQTIAISMQLLVDKEVFLKKEVIDKVIESSDPDGSQNPVKSAFVVKVLD
jgi:hypothetical protein